MRSKTEPRPGHTLDWTKVASESEYQPRDSVSEMVFDDHMWIMGGWFDSFESPPRDVWKSADGRDWNIVTSRAPWKHSDFAMGVVFRDRMWIMGGWYNGRLPNHSATNEVWSSKDGKNWDLVTEHAEWTPRLAGGCVAFDGKIWIIGGSENYYFGDKKSLRADVWNSVDGKTWKLVAESAPWGGRAYFKPLAFHGKLWVMGGGNYVPEYEASNDVWSSPDGKHWTKVTGEAAWPPRLWFASAVYRDRMWILGGWSRDRTKHPARSGALVYGRSKDGTEWEANWADVWHSQNGRTWERLESGTIWRARHAPAAFVFQDKLWVTGGHALPLISDVWSLELPPEWPKGSGVAKDAEKPTALQGNKKESKGAENGRPGPGFSGSKSPGTSADELALRPALAVRLFDSNFAQSHDSFNGISCASDGKIYYVLSSKAIDMGARMYSYDSAKDEIRLLGDLTLAAGEKGRKAIPQGKVHVSFAESNDKLYFATHLDYCEVRDGREAYFGVPPTGYKPYPGGHFLSYDIAKGKFADLGIPVPGEGILAMSMDKKRGRLYGLTWPTGYLVRYILRSKEMSSLGKVQEGGEAWPVVGSTYRTLCRSLAVNEDDGSVYFTRSDGAILRLPYGSDTVETLDGVDMRKDYFGTYDPSSAGTMGYNWRQMHWHSPEKVFYGVHGNSGYLFRFDPGVPSIELLDRITSRPSKIAGMYDQYTFGYLGLTFGPDQHTLHYLTGAPIFRDGQRLAGDPSVKFGSKGAENFHLVTYDIQSHRYSDQGPILLRDGQRPEEINSIAIGKDGSVYTLARVVDRGHTRVDLIQIRIS